MTKDTVNAVIKKLEEDFPLHPTLSREEITKVARAFNIKWADINSTLVSKATFVSRGRYNVRRLRSERVLESNDVPALTVPPVQCPSPESKFEIPMAAFKLAQQVSSIVNEEVFIPDTDSCFVRWGEYDTVAKVISTKTFCPIFISGPSGNGKTMMVEQACAKLKREYIRIQISPETDEDDLIGGFRLLNGETVFCKGPVLKAMERGCILLIDEVDRGSNKIMCLQGVLEGKPVLVKKTGQIIYPAPGFNIIATANTNGRGSEDGRYSAATIIDDAFLERFVATIDQPYASQAIERRILMKHMDKSGKTDDGFVDKLVAWSSVIRKTFESEAIADVVSTRRLCHIIKTFSIFEDRAQAISLCIARFEPETRNAFFDLYSKLDASIVTPSVPLVSPLVSPDETSPQA